MLNKWIENYYSSLIKQHYLQESLFKKSKSLYNNNNNNNNNNNLEDNHLPKPKQLEYLNHI